MSKLFQFRLLFSCTILLSITMLYSCDKDTNISLGTTNESYGVVTVDSMTVNTSTYQLLYLPSAGPKVLLVGKSTQADIGSVSSTAYSKLIYEAINDAIPADATFDSVNLVIRPSVSRYYNGDTTKVQTINVHRVTEELKTTNLSSEIDNFNTPIYVAGPTIFNNQSFAYDAQPLGTLSFNPHINSIDTLSIKLDDAFGRDLYDKIVRKDWTVSSNEELGRYLKGISLVPGTNNSVVIGLNDTLTLNLNYSYIGSDGFKKIGKKSLSSIEGSLQYNNIKYDRTGTAYANINNTDRELTSSQTNGKVLIQSGAGLAAKINIPALHEFINNEDIAINKIELIIEASGKNYGYYPSPSSMMLLIENSNGVPFAYVTNPFSNTIQSSSYIPGNEFGVNGKYIFNLIEYVKNINKPSYKNTNLLLATSSPALFNTVNSTFIATENGKPKIKLNIVYTKFK